jgi:hypothetical protein
LRTDIFVFYAGCGLKETVRWAGYKGVFGRKGVIMKYFIIFILVVAVIGGFGYYFVTSSNTTFNLAVWQGYSSYTTFAKAIDLDEFLGQPLDEGGLQALMTLAVFTQDGDKLSADIVSGSKLTERYGVSESLRRDYNYLAKISPIKGATSYAACFNGENWVVLKYKEE